MANYKIMVIPVITVTIIIALVIVISHAPGHNDKPCMNGTDKGFMQEHIILRDFNRTDKKEWSKYLKEKKLCGRENVQSFIDATVDEVKEICSPEGEHVSGNLCRSKSEMIVYDVESTMNCNVNEAPSVERQVVVACDKVGDECLPVDYQATVHVSPKGGPCIT